MKFLKYITYVVVGTITVIACESNQTNSSDNDQNEISSSVLFGNKAYKFPLISPAAINYVSNWAIFEDFKTEAFEINGNTINELKAGSERLIARVDSLVKKIPDTLDTKQIYSRLLVVKTRSKLLFQEANKVRVDSVKIQQHISEMNIATSNLIVQINEKFEKDAIDFERTDNEKKELELQKKKADSIFKAELEDNKQ